MPVTAVTLQPILERTMTAMLPTPPVDPVTKTSLTFSPNSNSSLALTANAQSKAVKPEVPNIIACLVLIPSGFFIKKSFFTQAYCEYPP